MDTTPFHNVENQIGYCGIWCGSCPAGNGSVVELTKRYQETLRKNNVEKWAPKDFDFNEFMKGLSSLQRVSICPGCHRGGGDSACAIRACARTKNLPNCGRCNALTSCDNLDKLEKNYPKIRQDLLKTIDISQQELTDKWKLELRTKFPHCLVLCDASRVP